MILKITEGHQKSPVHTKLAMASPFAEIQYEILGFKNKKPVQLKFIDRSNPGESRALKRKEFEDDEKELNRREAAANRIKAWWKGIMKERQLLIGAEEHIEDKAVWSLYNFCSSRRSKRLVRFSFFERIFLDASHMVSCLRKGVCNSAMRWSSSFDFHKVLVAMRILSELRDEYC